MQKVGFVLVWMFSIVAVLGQKTEVQIPKFQDKYSTYVKKLESGKTDVDYQDFRFSFLDSKQFQLATQQVGCMDSLNKELYKSIDKKQYKKTIAICTHLLSIDYTNMLAHQILTQMYQFHGDSVNAKRHNTIQFGLLNSIIKSGDGRSCKTAWKVIQVSEEYFLMQILNARIKSQNLLFDSGMCDQIIVEINKAEEVFYFDLSKVFKKQEKTSH